MSKFNFCVLIIVALILACEQNKITIIEKETDRTFLKGEWLMEKDTTQGITVRKGILGFFENWQITADSIYDYKIVDSVRITKNSKITVSTFLKRTNEQDTLYSEIIKHNDSIIILKKKQQFDHYRLTQ